MSDASIQLDVVVVDADVASFIVNNDWRRLPRYSRHLQGKNVLIPFAAYAEMMFGAELKNWGESRRSGIEAFVQRGLLYFPNRDICLLWAQIRAAARRSGRPLPEHDAWMAATALYLDVPLVTHNARHYAGVPELQLITEPDTPSS